SSGIELISSSGELSFSIQTPGYLTETINNAETRIRLDGENTSYTGLTGYPRLPVMTYTFALPPGSRLKKAEFSGTRFVLPGEYQVEASLPPMYLNPSNSRNAESYELYSQTRKKVYSGQEPVPVTLGEVHATGERREYSLVTVTLFPFHFEPTTSTLSVAPSIDINLEYEPVDAEHASFISRFLAEGTIYPDVPEHVYNAEQARQWYRPDERLLEGERMVIITTDEIKGSSQAKLGWYGEWRRNNGFLMTYFITVEEIAESAEGDDLPQKIRNWLRSHAQSYEYLLIIGHHDDIPMRILTPYNNNCYTGEPTTTPNPSDLYYADLSMPDNQSWNDDEDAYYGEAMSLSGFLDMQDSPDLETELHVGRINTSDPEEIGQTLEHIWMFEYDKSASYKDASVLAGSWLWYPNRNGWGLPGFDAAYYMEYLINNSVVKRSEATTLYEEAGLMPSTYSADLALTKDNLLDELMNNEVGIFIENNHGLNKAFYRSVWVTDDDEVPQDYELSSPQALGSSNTWELKGGKSNVAFLLSCLNGEPESDPCLAQALLNDGSVSVLAHTRSALGEYGWTDYSGSGQNSLYYYVLENYLKKPATYDYVLGPAMDAGRLSYYNAEKSTRHRFLNCYGHALFGDPALRHYGREGALPEGIIQNPADEQKSIGFSVDESGKVSYSLPQSNHIRLEVWDALGRKVQTLEQGYRTSGNHSIDWFSNRLPKGTYFLTLRFDGLTYTTKAMVLH
ncbi:T9SS type A sorting domain-containing protein, partial [candidate division WOR-3 bacterium]|nr:T9SS type A sorting domain-containing protein [candidate division WOR-3 bacterium]MBD3364085.1 T9SS type A sorting domain-containing protein [candidate division WOR-3 bacterium]